MPTALRSRTAPAQKTSVTGRAVVRLLDTGEWTVHSDGARVFPDQHGALSMALGVFKSPLTVCLVAGNCLAASYLRQILADHNSIRALTLERYLRLSPDQRKNTVFVIDLFGLEVPLVEMLRHLRTHCLNARFLLVDREKSTEQIGWLLLMGAQGFLPHGEVSRRLVRAIFVVAANQFWAPPEALQEFLREAASALRKDEHGRQRITPREAEIVDLVHRRLSNREIAQLLKIKVSTVKFHISNILSKMHARSRHDLVETPSELLSRILPS